MNFIFIKLNPSKNSTLSLPIIKKLLLFFLLISSINLADAAIYTSRSSRGTTHISNSSTQVSGATTPVVVIPPAATATATAPPTSMQNMPYVNTDITYLPYVEYTNLYLTKIGGVGSYAGDNGDFRIACGFSHMNNDDPIVFPGQQGKSHLHTFAGNRNTNYLSTNNSLVSSGNSTCSGGTANRSAYWTPAVVDTTDGKPQEPNVTIVYYKTGYVMKNFNKIVAIPAGLRMVAGKASSIAPQDHSWFLCDGVGYGKIPKNCKKGSDFVAVVEFPSCWDGVNLDSPDHISHMAYENNDFDAVTGCPSSHPVHIPNITMNVHYEVKTTDTSKWRLVSDNYDSSLPGGYSGHGDYMNGWTKDPLTGKNFAEVFTDNCLKAARDCGSDFLGDGRQMNFDWKY
jgi:hypothetical protein